MMDVGCGMLGVWCKMLGVGCLMFGVEVDVFARNEAILMFRNQNSMLFIIWVGGANSSAQYQKFRKS